MYLLDSSMYRTARDDTQQTLAATTTNTTTEYKMAPDPRLIYYLGPYYSYVQFYLILLNKSQKIFSRRQKIIMNGEPSIPLLRREHDENLCANIIYLMTQNNATFTNIF